MTRTEHLQLYRWVPEDFVNLEQVNANFDALETVGGNYNTAAETLRHHLAHDAQAQHHAGRSLLRRKNLLTVDLSKKEGEVQSLEQLQTLTARPSSSRPFSRPLPSRRRGSRCLAARSANSAISHPAATEASSP